MGVYKGGTKVAGGNIPFRDLTKAQYDALSTAEKNNGTIYMTTDEEDANFGLATPTVDGWMSSTDKAIIDAVSSPVAYTPVVTASSGTLTSYTGTVYATIIGRLVVLTFDITITNKGTGTGTLYVTLPSGMVCNYASGGAGREVAVSGTTFACIVYGDGTTFGIYKYDNGTIIATNARVVGSIQFVKKV
jgi:hypothetical protein